MYTHLKLSNKHYVQRFCSELKISKENAESAIKIAKNIRTLTLILDHIPSLIAAGSLLLMAHIKHVSITKKKNNLIINSIHLLQSLVKHSKKL